MKTNSIFEVDVKGLRVLQDGKPKYIIIRELLQNALDEQITSCDVVMQYFNGKAHFTVTDDSPVGFRDLADSYTLFADTYKRSDANKRGRFNFGEKQVICLCDYARIITTTGAVEFDILSGQRKALRKKREVGSEVYVIVKMTQDEYRECFDYCKHIIEPSHCAIGVVYGEPNKDDTTTWVSETRNPLKQFTAKLLTELKEGERMRNVSRETQVHLYERNGSAYIFELGIPICEIECAYSIDVQQKVPLSNDRDKVDGKYLRDLYALVLNNTVEEIKEEDISQTWIRSALDSDKVEAETIVEVKEKRFGDKAMIFNPFDELANDEAISKGYRLIHGSEMSANEWSAMKTYGGLVSTTSVFGKTPKSVEYIDMEKEWFPMYRMAKKIAMDYANYELSVVFYKDRQISCQAAYGGNELSFNLAHLPQGFFLADEEGYIKHSSLDLLIHELGHRGGHHTDHSYHDYITSLGAWIALRASKDKNYLKLK